MIYFSATTKGFYPTHIIDKERYEMAGTWPNDAVEISEDEYRKYLSTPPPGMELGSINGMPAWVAIEVAKEDLILIASKKKNKLMDEAERAITLLSRAVRLGMATKEDEYKLEAWERYSVLLSRVDVNKAPDIEWPVVP